jgi:hypothetical protein
VPLPALGPALGPARKLSGDRPDRLGRRPDRPGREVPQAVRNKALLAGGAAWLAELPQLIEELARLWAIQVGSPYPDPTEAFVAEAVLGDGTPVVLKVVVPRPGDGIVNEITALRLADDRGCVRLLAADPDRGALLSERLGRPLSELGLPPRHPPRDPLRDRRACKGVGHRAPACRPARTRGAG